jgi:beta-lactamase regulating signal transducer with metallopeptidase domain
MEAWLQIGLSNAVAAIVLAVPATLAGVFGRRPALAHALWLLVLIKLLTPPLVTISVPWLTSASSEEKPAPKAVEEEAVAPVLTDDSLDLAMLEVAESLSASGTNPQTDESNLDPPPPERKPLYWGWQPMLAGLWILGTSCWLVLASIRLWRFGRMVWKTRQEDEGLQNQVARLARLLG